MMKKKYIVILVTILINTVLFGQERIASKVYFQSGEETIEGILIRPHMKKNTPAVVFQQGSGNHSFDGVEKEAWGPHKFYIEDLLLEKGYAVLYCNKRGLGNSTGNWRKNSLQGRANDAYAAVKHLKTLDFINPDRIGVAGHSQGGWVAQIVASQHEDVAFVLALAGPTVGVKEQTGSNDSLFYLCKGYSGKKLDKKMKRNRFRRNLGYGVGKLFGFIGEARFWYLIANYNNDEVLKAINCPTLLLFAEYDINVDPEQNIRHFNKVFDNNPPDNFSIKVMKGGQHAFYLVKNRCVSWEEAMKQPFDPEFQNEIREWLSNL